MHEYIGDLYTKFYKDLQKYIFSNNVMVTASGFAIGIATKEVITKILSIIIGPLFEFFKRHSYKKIMSIPFLNIPLEIFWTLLLWLTTIVFTFIFLEYFLNKTLFGMVSTVKEGDEKTFIKSKVDAKTISIIPKSEDSYLKELNIQDQKINKIVSMTKEEGSKNTKTIIQSELAELFQKYYD